MSDINKTDWKKVDKGMKDKVLKDNDTWKTFTEEKKVAFCKYLKEKQKIVSRLAKLLESNIPTFGDSVRQHLRNFCNGNGGKPEVKAKAEKNEGSKESSGPQWTTQTGKKNGNREKHNEENGEWIDDVYSEKNKAHRPCHGQRSAANEPGLAPRGS